MASKYNLTDTQVRHLAIICFREQGSNDAGVRACASHMCNYYEKYQQKNFRDVYECTFGSGWYWSKEKNEEYVVQNPYVPQSVVNAVKDVIVNGNRSLPEYIDEYDQLKDIKLIINDGVTYTMARNKEYVLNRANYHKDKTRIENKYADPGERYTFYCFPDGVDGSCDAFGYINKSVPTTTGSTANPVESAAKWMEALAADNSHGYSQANRWGPDYDCSSAVITAYQQAGVKVKTAGATYTGNLRQVFLECGFEDVTTKCNLDTGAGMLRGDVLLYHISGTNGHAAMFVGNGKIAHARGQSYGSPATGDQGTEIAVTSYSRSKWQYVLRYKRSGDVNLTETLLSSIALTVATMPEIRKGSAGASVAVMQGLLCMMGYKGMGGAEIALDGEYGANTEYAVLSFQKAAGLTADGICGRATWKKLKDGMVI